MTLSVGPFRSPCDECFAPGVVVCEYTGDSLCLRHVHISPEGLACSEEILDEMEAEEAEAEEEQTRAMEDTDCAECNRAISPPCMQCYCEAHCSHCRASFPCSECAWVFQ